MVVLYAALAIGAANCLVLHAEQPPAHHHSQSHLAHSALCAWACQINPTVIVPTPLSLLAVATVVARINFADFVDCPTFLCSLFSSRAPPVV
jgi:hypothetical protein